MSNKIKYFVYKLGFVLGFVVLFFPFTVDASPVNPDTVIKAAGSGSPDIFYVATDGKRYKFPDPGTFSTWYESFGVVKEVGADVFKQIPDGAVAITSRPGAKLITFKGSNRVYVVLSGAFIRWAKKEKIAEEIYGKNWNSKIVEIPIDQVNNYFIGQPIQNAKEYNAFLEREKNISPNAELVHRHIIGSEHEINKKPAPQAKEVALLTSIKTTLFSKLSPKFNSYSYTYNLDAEWSEDYAGITVKTKNSGNSIRVNGVPTMQNSAVRVMLSEGKNLIGIEAITADGNVTSYTLNVFRKAKPAGEAHLLSLTENLKGNLEPAFSPQRFDYNVSARYTEDIIRLVPKAVRKSATIKINGVEVTTGAAAEINIPKGESKIKISVNDEDRSILYTITVTRETHLSDDLAKLKDLNTELKSIGPVSFKPDVRDYYLDVDKNRTSLTVTAKALDKNARVYINDVEANKRSVKLYAGETRITIIVISAEGAKVTYRLFVNRVL